MKIPLLKSFTFLLILLVIAALPLQAQDKKKNIPFIKQGTILTGISFSFTKADISHNISVYNQSQQSNLFAVVGIQLDALYFVTGHIGVGPLLGYQSLYTNYRYSNKGFSEWNLKYGFQAGGYVPVQAIFGAGSRSQLFLKGGISWLKENNTSNGSYNFGYKVGLGTLFPLGERVAVELALNYLARSEDKTNIIVCGVIPPCNPPPTHDTIWHRNITLSVGFNVALF